MAEFKSARTAQLSARGNRPMQLTNDPFFLEYEKVRVRPISRCTETPTRPRAGRARANPIRNRNIGPIVIGPVDEPAKKNIFAKIHTHARSLALSPSRPLALSDIASFIAPAQPAVTSIL